MNRRCMAAAIMLTIVTTNAAAMQLSTPRYDVHIDNRCEEGTVVCDDVHYHGIRRSNGQQIRLQGRTWHAPCADGVTPCRFLGYVFRNGPISYVVSDDGLLTVSDGDGRILLQERGEWQD